MQGSTYSQPRHWDEVGWLVLRSAAFTPGEIPRYSFYRRLSGPQGQSGHEGVKKNLHPSDTRDRTRAVQLSCVVVNNLVPESLICEWNIMIILYNSSYY